MSAVKWIAIWGMVSTVAALAAAALAGAKRRDHSAWAAWTFVFPPLVLVLLAMPSNPGPRPRRPTLDEEDMTHN